MSQQDDGGPAFPAPEAGLECFGQACACPGMSLRDYFAAEALARLPLYSGEGEKEFAARIAQTAYCYADAMLAERCLGRGEKQ